MTPWNADGKGFPDPPHLMMHGAAGTGNSFDKLSNMCRSCQIFTDPVRSSQIP